MSEFVGTTIYGWGRGPTEADAVANALYHSRRSDSSETRLVVWEVHGFEDCWPFGVKADTVHSEEEFILDHEDVERVVELSGELDRTVEEALANAD